MRPFFAQTRFPVLILAALVSLALAQPRAAFGQSNPKVPSPQQLAKGPQPVDQEQFVSYWTSETGWKSELQLRNNALGQDLTVTPALRLPDGTEAALAPVTIKPQEVTSIDLDAAIAAAVPQLVGAYGSLVLRYRSPSLSSLYAALMVRSVGHPFAFHIDGKGALQNFETGSREGIWWLPKATTSDYLIMTNQGKNAIALELLLYDATGKVARQNLLLGPHETNRSSLRKLVQDAGLTGSYGGIKISTISHAGSLDTLHFLFDETAGFSAILKMFDYHPEAKLEERIDPQTEVLTLRAPMLALTNPDPALAFPPGTTLQPQLFIRNTTGKAIDAALRFSWRSASSTGKAPGPALHLNPFETRRIDVAALQNVATLPKAANWTSVMLTTNGLPDEVMAVAASYDETLRYGAQTPFNDQLSAKWEGGMWEFDPYHSSIITAGNGGTKPTQAAFTLFYNQGTQRYDLEQTLRPDEQMWIDVGNLIRGHVPDKNGKVLPADLASGSYEFRDLTDFALGSLFEGKVIYDKTYGHAAYGCANCCGTMSTQTWFDPLGILLGSTADQGVNGYNNCSLTWDDISGYFYNSWSTANTAIATVDTSGTHTGVSVGSTTSSSWANLREGSNGLYCPRQRFAPSGGANVQKPGYLKVVNTSTDTTVCMGLGCEADIRYRVLDTNRQPMNISGMTIKESISGTTTCSNGTIVDSGQWTTDSTGTLTAPDVIYFCCLQGANCRLSMDQTFTVNGQSVLVIGADGQTTGIKNTITINCTNGQASCPGILISLRVSNTKSSQAMIFERKLDTRVERFETSGRTLIASVIELAYEYELPTAIEYINHDATTRPIDLRFQDESIRGILTALILQIPEYRVTFSDGVVDLYVPKAREDPSNLFNKVIKDFAVSELDTHRADMELVCTLARELVPPGGCGGSIAVGQWGSLKITLHLHNATVFEILNAMVAQNGKAVWTVMAPPDKLSKIPVGGLWHVYPLEPSYRSGVLERLSSVNP
jgi:hypothetical protein